MLNYLLFFCIGSCFGSFFTVISERLPLGNSLIRPASHCLNCQHPLARRDLVPVASYLCLKGRCRYCQQTYPKISLIAEILTGLLFSLLAATNLWTLTFTPGLLLMATAILLSLTDILYLLVEPLIFYPMTLAILLAIILLETPFSFHLIDSLIILAVLFIITKIVPKSLGYGDILLLSSWGLFLGAYALNLIILWASLLALFYAVIRGKQARSQPIPFVPFLSSALIAYLLWQ